MTINLKGIQTPEAPETRDVAYLTVEYNNQIYDWQIYVPRDVNIAEYINANEQKIYDEIDKKETEWANLSPKTRTIMNPMTREEMVLDIAKEEIVRADFPDYFAKRRSEYPLIGDQLDAIWKGIDSEDFSNMILKIQEIKSKYPKA